MERHSTGTPTTLLGHVSSGESTCEYPSMFIASPADAWKDY